MCSYPPEVSNVLREIVGKIQAGMKLGYKCARTTRVTSSCGCGRQNESSVCFPDMS